MGSVLRLWNARPSLVVLLPVVMGCGYATELVPVVGTVTLDGAPLEGATVIFRPRQGRPSSGTTDAVGRYELRYTDELAGALPGEHVVEVLTARGDDGSGPPSREKLPARYHARSELRATVSKTGTAHDFAIESR